MKFYHCIFIISLFFTFQACTQGKQKAKAADIAISEIDSVRKFPYHIHLPKEGKDSLKASVFADTVEYIRLQTPKDVFLGSLVQYRVRVLDSLIILNTFFFFFVFNRDGTFKKQIGSYGKGPGEHLSIFTFEIVGDTIFVSSSGRVSLLKYTLDGTFCDEISTQKQIEYLNFTPKGELAYYDRNLGAVLFLDKKQSFTDTLKVEYNVPDRWKVGTSDPTMIYLQRDASNLYFNDYVSDTTWVITPKGKKPAFILDLENKLAHEDQLQNRDINRFKAWEQKFMKKNKAQVVPFDSKIFIFQNGWLSPHYRAIYIYDKQTARTEKFETTFIEDDLVGMQGIYPLMSSQSMILGAIDPFNLSIFNKNNYMGEPTPEWLKQMEGIDKYDNQILVIFKMKK